VKYSSSAYQKGKTRFQNIRGRGRGGGKEGRFPSAKRWGREGTHNAEVRGRALPQCSSKVPLREKKIKIGRTQTQSVGKANAGRPRRPSSRTRS